MRRKGSCRFEPYFKIEVLNPAIFCWTPIQKAYATREEAEKNAPDGTYRIIEVSEKGIKV